MKVKDVFGGCLLSIVYLIIGLTIPVLIFLFFNYTTYWWYLFLKDMPKEQLEVIDRYSDFVGSCIVIGGTAALGLIYLRWKIRRKKIMKKSDENNTFITAQLVLTHRIRYSAYCNATYEYTLNGEIKKHHVRLRVNAPDELKLYPKKENSSKFSSNIGSDNPNWYVIPLIGVAFWILLIWVVGMTGMISSLIS